MSLCHLISNFHNQEEQRRRGGRESNNTSITFEVRSDI